MSDQPKKYELTARHKHVMPKPYRLFDKIDMHAEENKKESRHGQLRRFIKSARS
jgi:hypothetical protein